jgi:NADH-quinone oxidoreductase subunit G
VAAPIATQPGDAARAIAASLLGGHHKAVLLGNAAAQHPRADELLALANFIAEQSGASCGYLGEAANSVGAQLVGAQPGAAGLNAAQMLAKPLKAYVLLNAEPVLDAADAAQARAALGAASMVVSLSAFKSANLEFADVMLPIAPFTETAGSFVNAEGRVQSFHGVVKPRGDARPAWKLLRVLGTLLGLEGFGFETAEEVRAQALGDLAALPARLSNASRAAVATSAASATLERIADVPIYSADAIVRRAPSLQATADARPPRAGLPTALWQQLGLADGQTVVVQQGSATVLLPACHDASLAPTAVRVPAGHPATAALGAMFGPIAVEKA